MQLMNYRKQLSLSLLIAFAATAVTPSAYAFFPCDQKDAKKVIGATILLTAITCFVRLVTKKTQPKRVYPKDDSYSELGWYIFDELMTGQMEKGERPSKVTIDDLANPQELTIQYSKIESRGLTGIIYSSMKPVIIPALTMMLLFNKDFLEKVKDSIFDTRRFIEDPSQPINIILDAINGPLPSKNPQPAKIN